MLLEKTFTKGVEDGTELLDELKEYNPNRDED